MRRIDVAVGIIANRSGELLVGQRTVKDQYYRKWEFPGGKIEPEETVKQALARELKEELGITLNDCQPLMVLEHDYPDRKVRLFVRKVVDYAGKPQGIEGQALKWIAPGGFKPVRVFSW